MPQATVRFNWAREQVQRMEAIPVFVRGNINVSDLLTKPCHRQHLAPPSTTALRGDGSRILRPHHRDHAAIWIPTAQVHHLILLQKEQVNGTIQRKTQRNGTEYRDRRRRHGTHLQNEYSSASLATLTAAMTVRPLGLTRLPLPSNYYQEIIQARRDQMATPSDLAQLTGNVESTSLAPTYSFRTSL